MSKPPQSNQPSKYAQVAQIASSAKSKPSSTPSSSSSSGSQPAIVASSPQQSSLQVSSSSSHASVNGKFHGGSPRMHNSYPLLHTNPPLMPAASRKGPYVSHMKGPRNSVQFPVRPPNTQGTAPIQFGSINQPNTAPLSSSPIQHTSALSGGVPQYPQVPSGGSMPTFGTISANPPSEEVAPTPTTVEEQPQPQPQPHPPVETMHSPHTRPVHSSPHLAHHSYPHHPQTPPHHHRQSHHFQKGGAPIPMGMSPAPSSGPVPANVPSPYGHQQKKPMAPHASPHSPHLTTAPSPNMQPMVPAVPHQPWAQQYYVAAPYSPTPQYFPGHHHPMYGMPPYSQPMPQGMPMGIPHGVPNQRMPMGQQFTPQPKASKAIPIINPNTRTEVKASDVASSSSSQNASPRLKKAETSEPQEKDSKDESQTTVAPTTTGSRAVKIVDPAAKEREEQEKRKQAEREQADAERKRQEEKEKKEQEEKERAKREEEERKKREEKERLEREEKERLEREEKERLELEEKERREKEARELREKEEQERKEREQKEREEKERKEREERERREKEQKEKEERESIELEEKRKAENEAVKTNLPEDADKPLESQNDAAKSTPSTTTPPKVDTSVENVKASDETTSSVVDSPTTLQTSHRIIEDPSAVAYPPDIKPPKSADKGKYKYDRDFLMQFMHLCKERPEGLPLVESVIGEDAGGNERKPSSAGRRAASGSQRGIKSPAFAQFPADMGQFKKTTSEERFQASTHRMNSTGGFIPHGPGRPSLGPRSASSSQMLPSSGSSGGSPRDGRSRSGRGISRKGTRDQHHQQQGGPTTPSEPVEPLQKSENRWVPTVQENKQKPASSEDQMPMELVQRKVKSLLNKLTLEKFESISDQIIEFANRSLNETDGTTMKLVIQLVFEKATDESNFATMYAQLCRRMMEKVKEDVKDESLKLPDGRPASGGHLFRKYLLTRCQEDFERGWKFDVPKTENGEVDIMSDEYYVAVKAKRRGLGLIRFIGELFKLNMLTERIMHGCIQKLLTNVDNPEEEEMESLCQLMTTVGKQLDRKEAKGHMDLYFSRMVTLSKNTKLPSRIRFMLQDVIDLRSNRWAPRRDLNAPKTIAEIHEDAAKAQEEKDILKRSTSSGGRGLPNLSQQLTRSSSHRVGKERGTPQTPSTDGWSTVGGSSSVRKAGDLGSFGRTERSKIQRSNLNLGPGSSSNVFASLSASKSVKSPSMEAPPKKGENGKPSSGSSSSPQIGTSNMFSALLAEGGSSERQANVEGEVTPSPPTERKKLNILPRTKPLPEQQPASDAATAPSDTKLTQEEAEKKIKNALEEFWSVRNVEELIYCIKELDDAAFHVELLTSLVNSAVERKKEDVELTCKVLRQALSSDAVALDSVHKALAGLVEMIDDLSIDVPAAYSYVGQFLVASQVDLNKLTEMMQPLLSLDGIVPPAAKLTAEYLKALRDVEGEEKMAERYRESSFDLKTLFPEDKRTDEAINAFLSKQGLSNLCV
ncbi:uncharacterized protein VTP21DRAFT_3483 [Calcarisporiella thermophila]|uniref:uncharacterized protein n=1 Tax=Calcarisporiella thermophila TaxID=911321 RepID=UPI0037423C50